MPTVALLSWPFIAMAIFAVLGPARGMIWTLLVGFLFLPEEFGFDLPALPPYDKFSAISFSLLLGILISRRQIPEPPEISDTTVRTLITGLIALLFLGILGTVLDNASPIVRNGRFQSGHGIRDLISMTSDVLVLMMPFFLARRWLISTEIHIELLRAIVILALIYSLLVLIEWRLSPRLNRWVYGLQMDAWRQHVRGGGFRAMVFLNHGLAVGYFLFTAVIAAVGMARASQGGERAFYFAASVWLFFTLVLSRNTGALILAVVFAPMLAMFSYRMLLRVMVLVACFYMFYPLAKQFQLVPTQQIVSLIEKASAERAESIEFRFKNEVGLLARAAEKPLFGWGGWGRSRLVDKRGQDVSTPDGIWVIRLGVFGWVGYVTYFGLLTVPLILLRRCKDVPVPTLTLAMATTANLVYLVPNSTLSILAWMISGATVAFLQYKPASPGAPTPAKKDPREARHTAYSRFPVKDQRARSAQLRWRDSTR